MRTRLLTLLLLSSLAAAPAWAQEEPEPKLLILAYKGVDKKLVAAVAKRVGAEYGVATEVLKDAPKPQRDGERDSREKVLPQLAKQLGIEVGKKPNWSKVDKACRKKLSKLGTPQAKQMLGLLDTLGVQLKVESLTPQIEEVVGERLKANGVVGVLALTHQDLYGEGVNFYFGWVDGGRHAGVMSTFRFRPGAKKKLLIERASKQALSSAGFVLGIPRCDTKTCARAYPNSLEEHDAKPDKLCIVCKENIEKRFSR